MLRSTFFARVSLVLLCAFGLSLEAFALPIPRFADNHRQMPMNANYHFDGIVALSNCSGSLIRFENSKLTDQAMVLTNGHCLEKGMPRPGTFAYHLPSHNSFGLFDDQAKGIGVVHATEIIYSTMTGTDITLYKLEETYEKIQQTWNAHPLLLASKHAMVGTPIEVISGYWRRGYSCHIEAFIPHLHEDAWVFNDSVRYSRPGCEIIGGTSGSPIVQAGTRTVIAINNTTNENGEKCTMNNPCEIDQNGQMTATRGFSYGQETYQIYSCINAKNEFDLATPGCALLH
jgi:V8-like Glu-specific endopeptidase